MAENMFKDLPALETERTILRKLKMEDCQDMFEYCSDDEVMQFTTWYAHKTIDDTRNYIQFVLDSYARGGAAPWGIEHKRTHKLIGTCGFVYWDSAHSRAELGYVLARQYWNQGLMSEAASRAIEYGFTNMRLVRIEARCLLQNMASARVLEKAGMQFEGVLRKQILSRDELLDVKMYSIINGG